MTPLHIRLNPFAGEVHQPNGDLRICNATFCLLTRYPTYVVCTAQRPLSRSLNTRMPLPTAESRENAREFRPRISVCLEGVRPI